MAGGEKKKTCQVSPKLRYFEAVLAGGFSLGFRGLFSPPLPPSRLQRNYMEASLLAVSSVCDQDHFHASPHKGIQAFIPNYDLLQTGPGVFQWSQEMLMGFGMLYPVEWLSICMQRDTLKGLMTFRRLVPISISHHHPSVQWAMWLIFPNYNLNLTEQALGCEAPGVSHRGLC